MVGTVGAQDEAPTALPVETYPSHIHAGSCAEIDPAPAYEVGGVGPRLDDDGRPPPLEDTRGSLTAAPVLVLEADVDVGLDDLLAEEHALDVHPSGDAEAPAVACGDIGGAVLDGTLLVGLTPVDGSGYSGVAELERDDDEVEVTLYPVPPGIPSGAAAPTP